MLSGTPRSLGQGHRGTVGVWGGRQGGGGEGSGREAAEAREARGQARPTLCQTRESCRAFPAGAWLVVPAIMELSSQGCRAHSSREETEAQRRDSVTCWRSPAWQQPAKASGLSKQGQGVRLCCWEPQEGSQKSTRPAFPFPRKQKAV